jgi:two-component system phosphate regulon sensor histidine kinase PhoR
VSAEVLKDPNIVNQPERLLNYTSIIEKENLRLKQQVERVLQMARLDKEDMGLKKERVEMSQLIQDAIRNTSVALHEKRANIKEECDSDPCLLHVDKLHITNVLANLLDNAIKYCRVEPEITIKTIHHAKGVTVEVQDNGIGISSENHKRVFQKFFRVPTGNVHDVKGFGLGLSYVKTIIEAHGGTVSLQSEVGKGSLFRFFLPVD